MTTHFCSFSILKNNFIFLFSKKTYRKAKKKKQTSKSNTLTSILTYNKPKILLQQHSISASRYVGGDGLFGFSKQQRSWNYLQITQENVVIFLRTAFIALYQRAEVVALSCAKKRKLWSYETASCCWETQACDPKKSHVKSYIIPTRDGFPRNTLLYAHNSLWNKKLQYPCNVLSKA